jgi:hypothetical protein
MSPLRLLSGVVGLGAAAWLCGPAAYQGWKLLSLPLNSPRQPHLEFSVGSLSLTGWAFVGIVGGAGVLLAAFSACLLFPRDRHR